MDGSISLWFGTLGVVREDGQNYICKCSKCGKIDSYNKYALKNGQIKQCRFCKKFKGIEQGTTNKKKLTVVGYRNNPEDNSKIDVLVKCGLCGQTSYMTRQDFLDDRTCSICRSRSSKEPVTKVVSNKTLQKGTTLIRAGKNTDEQQLKSGEGHSKILPKSYSEHMKQLEQKEAEILADKGILKKDHVGEVYNGLIIIAQSTSGRKVKCNVQCTYCDASYNTDLSKVISYRMHCENCKDVRFSFPCPGCKKVSVRTTSRIGGAFSDERNIFTVTRGELYAGGVLKCPKCNKEINLATQAYNNDMSELRMTAISKIDTAKYGDFEKIDSKNNLVISKEPAYRGRDKEFRYNCYCLQHKKKLCLTAEQTIGYDHSFCEFDGHMTSVPLLKNEKSRVRESILD